VASRTDRAELRSRDYAAAGPNVDPREVRVERADAANVPNDDEVAVAAGVPLRVGHPPGASGADGSPIGRREVDPRMEAVVAGSEAVSDRSADRPHEADRGPRRRRTQRAHRSRAGYPVAPQAAPALVTEQRESGAGAEDAVDRPGREAVPGEEELEAGDVPTHHPLVQRAVPEAMACETPERRPCPRPGDAVDDEAGAALKAPDRRRRAWAGDAVDRAAVHPSGTERDLERGDTRLAHPKRGGGNDQGRSEDEQSDGRPGRHGRTLFALDRPLPGSPSHLLYDIAPEGIGAAAEQERRRSFLAADASQTRVVQIDLDPGPFLESECRRPFVLSDLEEPPRIDHVAAERLPAGDPFDLPQLFQRIDPYVRVGADAEPDPALQQGFQGREAVSQVRLRRRAEADARARVGEQIELVGVGVRPVHHRRSRPEAARISEQLDRANAVLGDAFLDLPRLLVGMNVERQPLTLTVAADLLEPGAGARTDGVGSEPHAPVRCERVDVAQIIVDGLLAEALDASAGVGDIEENELEAGVASRLQRGARLLEPDVVKLPHGRVAGGTHLPVGVRVGRSDLFGGQTRRQLEHRLTPGPEVTAFDPPPQRTLECVAVRVHEPGKRQPIGHRGEATIAAPMATRVVPAPLAHLPNALTILRLALIPVFVVLALAADGERTIPAAVVFGLAGITDQVDGWLARRWRVESEFGRFADPLADRLMIDAAVILLWLGDRLPWPALAVILARDGILLAGTPAAVRRGYEFSVSLLGKLATWVLYAALVAVLITSEGADWPLWLFWTGVGLALAAAVFYVGRAARTVGAR
jgi:CDP-diacylglycerol--glycerol-3-phosphate 3-phosphatidyltransferase